MRTRFGRMDSRGLHSHQLTASAFWVCLAIHCGRVGDSHLSHAAMSAVCHFPLLRPLTEEGLLHAMPQLLFPASTVQSLSVSKLHKRPSWASTPKNGELQRQPTSE